MAKYDWGTFGFHIPEIMLPKEGTDYSKWAVVACDQYTSEPEYWKQVEEIVGDAPSTLRLMLPEIFLERSGSGEVRRHPQDHGSVSGRRYSPHSGAGLYAHQENR